MREQWAKLIVLVTGCIVLILAIVFARIQNPTIPQAGSGDVPDKPLAKAGADSQLVRQGQQIYQQLGCSRCHAVAGQGNPRLPLDGVGTRRTPDELRHWITASGATGNSLPDAIRQFKQGYQQLPATDLDALVIYLQSLR